MRVHARVLARLRVCVRVRDVTHAKPTINHARSPPGVCRRAPQTEIAEQSLDWVTLLGKFVSQMISPKAKAAKRADTLPDDYCHHVVAVSRPQLIAEGTDIIGRTAKPVSLAVRLFNQATSKVVNPVLKIISKVTVILGNLVARMLKHGARIAWSTSAAEVAAPLSHDWAILAAETPKTRKDENRPS